MNKILEIKNLSIDYTNNHSSKKILDDINIDLYKGETLGIVGESGSGKTITGLAIAGLLDKKVFSVSHSPNIKNSFAIRTDNQHIDNKAQRYIEILSEFN